MAAMDPISVEFHIHQVVNTFQTSVVKNVYQKKDIFFDVLSATISNGTHAMNITKVSGETGQAANSKLPANNAFEVFANFFNYFFDHYYGSFIL